jgi:hypothetical protein
VQLLPRTLTPVVLAAAAAVAVAMPITAQMPDIMGERQSGQDVRTQNGNALPYLLISTPDSPWCPLKSMAPFGSAPPTMPC